MMMLEKVEMMYFLVVDKWGNVVLNMYMINGYFGLGVIVDGMGIVLNDEMDDFFVKLGVVNMFGVVGSDVNVIELKKCLLLLMLLMIMMKDGKVLLVIGMLGGLCIFMLIF